MFWCGAALCLAANQSNAAATSATSPPNFIIILADDLGYGDVQCNNPRGKIPTPNIDRLAAGGLRFTDAHSGSAVCTPTRYGILTGRYSWRTGLQSGVLMGYDKPLIAADRVTLPGLLRKAGYTTACFGKWHLGMDIPKATNELQIANGPTTRGFDYFFGISASLDMAPFAFIENDHLTQAPTATKKWVREGPAAPDFEAEDVLPELTRRTVEFIGRRAEDKKPFFIYMPLNSPHTPIVPAKEWRGKSGLGDYGDFVMQTDWTVGQVKAALDRAGLAGNTVLCVTSDNGCSPAAKVEQLEEQGHFPSAQFRGYKADIFEGGHRVPFIVQWPDRVQSGGVTDQTVCLTDFMATFADIVGVSLPDNAAEDSISLLPALLGKADKPLREAVIHHSINGSFSIRQGNWKLELCPGSGGWSSPKPGSDAEKNLPRVQLYDLAADPAEKRNLQVERPEVVSRLTGLIEQYIERGRSTPGKAQPNDAPIELDKSKTKRGKSK